MNLLETVTNISLMIVEHSTGSYTILSEDMRRDIDHLDCPQYLKSEFLVLERMDAVTYIAQFESRPHTERKMKFLGSCLRGDNGLKLFWKYLKLATSLNKCRGVVKFMGVVLDDIRKHVNSFLQEFRALGTIRSILSRAELREERVPWSVTATWASQIITAVAEIHSKGLVVGLLHLDYIRVRSDGHAVLDLRKRAYRQSINRLGEIAPESRTAPTCSSQFRDLDFCSDIFMLGMLLWQLVEYRNNHAGYPCLRNARTSVPRHSCIDERVNPVELLPCMNKKVPKAFKPVINLCRQADPQKRPPARTLIQHLNAKVQPAEMADFQLEYANTHSHLVYCDECGTGVDLETWYYCNICHLAVFDVCSHSVSQGIHGFEKAHRLAKRIFRNGSIYKCAKLTTFT